MIPNGYKKAVTFSFDDGVTQDVRLIGILDKYGLKCTFNLNSELLGLPGSLVRGGVRVDHNKVEKNDVRTIYSGHEVAVHTLRHPNLTVLDEDEVVRQVEQDRLNLSSLCGYEVIGMAYPCGGVNNDEHTAEIIKNRTGVRYARTIGQTHGFGRRDNLYRYDPTVYHVELDELFSLGGEFISLDALECDDVQVFYIWGHSYEFDIADTWSRFEEFCRFIGGKDDIFYGTNRDVLL
ncbi:MAG: polysaccharide deacetylase family protein [Clostridia bacterium]|nr:polysaccharide deacetylase family protein [Clostridia bacterium]